MKNSDSRLLSRIKAIIAEQDPAAKIYLYGSRSRSTAERNSDWDLLILLKKNSISLEDEQKITSPLYDLEFDTGEMISPMIYSEKEWNSKYRMTPFYKNVMEEAKLLR